MRGSELGSRGDGSRFTVWGLHARVEDGAVNFIVVGSGFRSGAKCKGSGVKKKGIESYGSGFHVQRSGFSV